VDVTAANADASVATRYVGTVHFTSTDPLAVLPADYTFTTGDNGSHTFSGVVLNTPYSETITVNDTATPFVKGSVTVNAHCPGVCQSTAGTPGGRSAAPGPSGSSGARNAAPGPGGVPSPRTPMRSTAGAIEPSAGFAGQPTAVTQSEQLITPSKTGLSVLGSDVPRTGVARPARAGYSIVATQQRDIVLASQRTDVTPRETDAASNAEVAISIGLLGFALLAFRRRRIGEELNVHDKT
jgi:hypothetical protein